MADERLRIRVDDDYAAALGRAAYTFARLEWTVVWCCERMQAGYITSLGRKTAGMIARDFLAFIETISNAEARRPYSAPGNEFQRLVGVRNKIMHGKPGTASSGEERLFHAGEAWTLDAINSASDEFVVCELSLNPLIHTLSLTASDLP